MPSDKLIKGMAKINALSEKAKPKKVYSSDPKRSRLERKMDKIGQKIRADKESYK